MEPETQNEKLLICYYHDGVEQDLSQFTLISAIVSPLASKTQPPFSRSMHFNHSVQEHHQSNKMI